MSKKHSISDHVELSNPFSERLFYITDKMDKSDAIYEQRIDELKRGYSEIEKTLVELSEATKFTKSVLSNNHLQSQDTVGISIEELDRIEALLIQLAHAIGKETLSHAKFIETSHTNTTNILSKVSELFISIFDNKV